MAPYAATKKNAQNSYSCTNDGSRGRRDASHRDACACIVGVVLSVLLVRGHE